LRIRTERMWSDLAVEHLYGDVRVVGRDLPPALAAVVGSDTYERDLLRRVRLDPPARR
jgi:hypothetical protein